MLQMNSAYGQQEGMPAVREDHQLHDGAQYRRATGRQLMQRRIYARLWLLFVLHLPHMSFGMFDTGRRQDNEDLFAQKRVVNLNITFNRTFPLPHGDGPREFPSFTLSSPLCVNDPKGAVAMAADSAGNVFSLGGGMLCKYNQRGQLDWARRAGESVKQGDERSHLAIGSFISQGQRLYVPGARGEHSVFVTGDTGVRSVDAETGKTLWKYTGSGAVHSAPLVVQEAQCNTPHPNSTEPVRLCRRNMIVFGAEDEKYYAIDFNGTLIWTSNFLGSAEDGWPLRFASAFGGNRIFVLSSRGVSALEVDGKHAWGYARYPASFRVVTAGSRSTSIQEHINSLGPVYHAGMVAYSSGHSLNVVSLDGSLLRQFQIKAPFATDADPALVDFSAAPVWHGSLILVSDSNSTLHCLSLEGAAIAPVVKWRHQFSQLVHAIPSSSRQRKMTTDSGMSTGRRALQTSDGFSNQTNFSSPNVTNALAQHASAHASTKNYSINETDSTHWGNSSLNLLQNRTLSVDGNSTNRTSHAPALWVNHTNQTNGSNASDHHGLVYVYADLSETCKQCSRDVFIYKAGQSVRMGCGNCQCGDGVLMCGCVYCPDIVPEPTFFPPDSFSPAEIPAPPLQLQPLWDQPVVSKAGMAYVRAPGGIHAFDVYTGSVLWIYGTQPLSAHGKPHAQTDERFQAEGGISLDQVHVRLAKWKTGSCGGEDFVPCQTQDASPPPTDPAKPAAHSCETEATLYSNRTGQGSPGGKCTPAVDTLIEYECGGDLQQHGQGQVTSDGALFFPCKNVMHRMCCAPCSVSVEGNTSVYPGGNVSLRIYDALPPQLATRVFCQWSDSREVRFPSTESQSGSYSFRDSVLITTEGVYGDTTRSEGTQVTCSTPGPEWDFPAMYLPARLVQLDSAGALHFCTGERVGVDVLKAIPPPPPSYVAFYIIGCILGLTLSALLLSRWVLIRYTRRTEFGLLESKFALVGLGGLQHKQYVQLLRFLKDWHRKHLPLVFGRWRRGLRREQVYKKLWKSDRTSVKVGSSDLDDVAHILSREYSQSPAARERARMLLEEMLEVQPTRADLWQIYLDLELQAQRQGSFRRTGELHVHVHSALVYHEDHSEISFVAKCAQTHWSIGGSRSEGAVPKFSQYSFFAKEYFEIALDRSTSFSLHRGFEADADEVLVLQVAGRPGTDPDKGGASGEDSSTRLPAQLQMPSEASAFPHDRDTPISQVCLPVYDLSRCSTTIQVEIFEVFGINATGAAAPAGPVCNRANSSRLRKVWCRLECIPAGLETGFVEETTGFGEAVTFFLPDSDTTTWVEKHQQETDKHKAEEVEGGAVGGSLMHSLFHSVSRASADWWPTPTSLEYFLRNGTDTELWGVSGGHEDLTPACKGEKQKQMRILTNKERLAKVWKQRDRLYLSVYLRERDSEDSELLGKCPVALKDLQLDCLHDQWLPLNPDKLENGYIRVRLKRQRVQEGEMCKPVWVPLASLSASHGPSFHPRMYAKMSVGFMPRQHDMLRLSLKHSLEAVAPLGSTEERSSTHRADGALRCEAIVQAGERTARIGVADLGELSLEIDDHVPTIRIAIVGSRADDHLNTRMLTEMLVVPSLDSGAMLRVAELEDEADPIKAEIVLTGHHLAAKDTSLLHGKSSDPFVEFTQSGVSVGKSEIIANNLNPTWKPIMLKLAPRGVVRITCMDHDMITQDDFIGEAIVSVKELLTTGQSIELWSNAQKAGRLRVTDCKVVRGNTTAEWERTKILAVHGARVQEARQECQALFLSWARSYSLDGNARRISTGQLKSTLAQYGVPEHDMWELLAILDTEAVEKDSVTLREFERYGMRYISSSLATFQDLLARVDLDGGAVHPRPDLMVLALKADQALSSAKQPTLRDALSFYWQRHAEGSLCCARKEITDENAGAHEGEVKVTDHHEIPHSRGERVSGANMGSTIAKKKSKKKRGRALFLCNCCFGRRRNKHGQEYSQEDEVQTSSHDRLPSQYGFSRTMRIPEIEGKLDLQAEYTYQEGSAERETGTHVRGNLNLHMSLVAGEEIENASQEELIENTRSLFRRIFTSRHLTARQIWRFVGQCEEWEDDLKRHSPLTFASILENVLRDAGLSPVLERSFEEHSFEDTFPSGPADFDRKLWFLEAKPSIVAAAQERPHTAKGRLHGIQDREASPMRPRSAVRPVSARVDTHSLGKWAANRPHAVRRPTSAISSNSGSTGLISPFYSERNKSVGHRDLAHETLREKLSTPTLRRTFFSSRVVPGSPGDVLDRLQEAVAASPQPDHLEGLQFESGISDGEVSSDESAGGGTHHSSGMRDEGDGKVVRPQTAPHPAEARVRRSVALRDKVTPWREMISSGCLTPVTPDPVFRATESDALDGIEWYSNESEGSMVRRRQEGRAMLRTWSARRFRSANHQFHSSMVGPGEGPDEDVGRAPTSAPRNLELPGSHLASQDQEATSKSLKERPVHSALRPHTATCHLLPDASRVRPFTAGAPPRTKWAGSVEISKTVQPVSRTCQHTERPAHGDAPQGVTAVIVEDEEAVGRGKTTGPEKSAADESEAAGERASWAQDIGRTGSRRSPVISENLAQQRQRSLQHLLGLSSQRSSVHSDAADMADTDRGDAGHVRIISAGHQSHDNFDAQSAAFSGGGGSGACRSGTGLRPSTAAPGGRPVPPAIVSGGPSGVTSSIHRLHSKMEDLSGTASWRNFDVLTSEKQALLLSFMDPSDRQQLSDMRGARASDGGDGDSVPHLPKTLRDGTAASSTADSDRTALRPRPSTAMARAGPSVKDIWKARANLKIAKARHDRQQVLMAEEMNWIYDRRIVVKGEKAGDDCKRVTLMGLGTEDYGGLAKLIQGDYKKTMQTQCGRAVYERLGGTAMWFVNDNEGGSQPSQKEAGDEGEWWIGSVECVGHTADVLIGPPARGVVRVRDSARIPAKIFHTWRVFRP